MAKIKVTKFNFSGEMLEKAKSENPLLGALARMASEMIEDGKVPCQQTMWIDTDKVVAVGEVVKAKEDAGIPDIYQVFFSHGEKPEGWQIVADSYDEFMAAWTGEITATFNREPRNLVERFRKEQMPAGLGPVKYVAVAGPKGIISKNVDGQYVDAIEIEYPDDDDPDEEKSELNKIVMLLADEILNTAGGDEQRHATEKMIHKQWMNIHGPGYRDCRTKVVIERSIIGKAKVKFLVCFAH